jgi:hypothetical protein
LSAAVKGPTVVLRLPAAEHDADAAYSHQAVITKLLLTFLERQTYTHELGKKIRTKSLILQRET